MWGWIEPIINLLLPRLKCMAPEGVTWRSVVLQQSTNYMPLYSFSFHQLMHTIARRLRLSYIHFENSTDMRRYQLERIEDWGRQKHEQMAFSMTDELFCIFNQNFFISILLNERLGRWYMKNFQIRKKNVLSVHLPITDILILVPSDYIATECPENTIAGTPFGCIQCHNM